MNALDLSYDEALLLRVKRGAAWLDEYNPGWEQRVVVGNLDLCNAGTCVLGQIFAGESDYDGYFWALDSHPQIPHDDHGDADFWAYDHGFDRSGDPATRTDDEYAALTLAWQRLLAERAA